MDTPAAPDCGTADVLAIPELLEIILFHVDMTTLLVSALRVNKTWNSLISNSSALQQALFFAPAAPETSSTVTWQWDPERAGSNEATLVDAAECDSSPASSISGNEDGAATSPSSPSLRQKRKKKAQKARRVLPIFNPLLLRKFGPCFFDFGPSYGFFRRTESFYTLPWTARSHQTVPTDSGGRYHPLYRLVKPMNLDETEKAKAEADRRRFTSRGASWRRMLVSQPPPPGACCSQCPAAVPASTHVSMGWLWWRPDGPYGGPEKLSTGRVGTCNASNCPALHEGLLTMGQLYDLVQYHAGHHELRSLWFRVTWGSPKPPYVTRIHQRARGELAAQGMAVVVEFLEFEDDTWFSRRETQCMDNFDKAFRCDEAKPPIIDSPKPGAEPQGSTQPDDYEIDILQSFVVASI
jgi:hypothetical protein